MLDNEFYSKVRKVIISHDLLYNDFVSACINAGSPFEAENFNMLQTNTISIINNMGEMTMNNLAKRLSMLPANLSPLIKDLEKRDWVVRFHKPDFDGRYVFVKLTERGSRLINLQIEMSANILKQALNDALSDDEQNEFLHTYEKLVGYFERINAAEGYDRDSSYQLMKDTVQTKNFGNN